MRDLFCSICLSIRTSEKVGYFYLNENDYHLKNGGIVWSDEKIGFSRGYW